MDKRPALGKGLSALIPDTPEPAPAGGGVVELDIDRLAPNDYQPRLQIDDASLDELAASIKANGIIQPIVVRADRRRLSHHRRRAAVARGAPAGLARVPVDRHATLSGDKPAEGSWRWRSSRTSSARISTPSTRPRRTVVSSTSSS